jgi:hypothetical protein
MTHLARLSLVAAAAAAMAACGGGEEPSAVEKTSARLEAISGSCTGSTTLSATSTGGVVPLHCSGYEQNTDKLPAKPSCLDLLGPTVGGYPVKEFGVGTNDNGNAFATWDELGTLGTPLPSFLTVEVEGALAQPLNWSATDTATTDNQVVAVLLKSGGQTHIYRYTTANSDSQLDPPDTTRRTFWYNVCYISKPIVTKPPQWCSPGYWKNHTGSWTVPTTTLYRLSTLTVKTTGRGCASAPGNGVATLYDVVSMPQCYGGEAANLVGDSLSRQAGLNFTGERVENCPLN